MSRKTFEQVAMGDEPEWGDTVPSNTEITIAYNWYNYFYDYEGAKKFFIKYITDTGLEDDVIKTVKSLNSWKFPKTIGWISRMKANGMEMDETMDEHFKKSVSGVLELCANDVDETVEVKKERTPVNVQLHIKQQVHNLVAYIEEEIDTFINDKYKSDFDMYAWLKKREVKALQSKMIGDRYAPLAEELESIKSEPDLKEAYSHLSKKEQKSYIKFIRGIVTDCRKWEDSMKTIRAPRKKKAKKPMDKVKKLNYMNSYDDWKITSTLPSKIIGARELWFINTKTRKIGVYRTEGSKGLDVKGSTIMGFDKNTSYSKTARKPKDIIDKIVAGKLRACKNAFDNIKAKESPLTGRINKDTILIKVLN